MAQRFDEDLSAAEWRQSEDRDDAEQQASDEAVDRFREDAEQYLQEQAAADTSSSDVKPQSPEWLR